MFDNLNGGIYMARGMNDEAFLSFASAVPIAGDAAPGQDFEHRRATLGRGVLQRPAAQRRRTGRILAVTPPGAERRFRNAQQGRRFAALDPRVAQAAGELRLLEADPSLLIASRLLPSAAARRGGSDDRIGDRNGGQNGDGVAAAIADGGLQVFDDRAFIGCALGGCGFDGGRLIGRFLARRFAGSASRGPEMSGVMTSS